MSGTGEYISRADAIEALYKDAEAHPEHTFWATQYEALRNIPAADVRPVVLCKNCVYWQKPQVWQNDGTFRDYEPGEYERGSIFGGVSLEVGVNYGSFCALYNRNHENQIPIHGRKRFLFKGI